MPSMDAILQLITAALTAWVVWKSSQNGQAIRDVHLAVNSRLDQLLAVTEKLATSKGVAAGREQVLEEQKKPPGS